MSATPHLACWLVAAALFGCEGEVGGNPEELGGAAGSGGGPVAAGGSAGGPTEPQGSTMLRRLNRLELANTLTSVTGTAVAAEELLPPDPEVQGFDTVATALETTPATVDQLMQLASRTAGSLGVEVLGACVSPADERGCALERVATFARRTLRRPATTNELSSYATLYDDVQAREGSGRAFRSCRAVVGFARLLVSRRARHRRGRQAERA